MVEKGTLKLTKTNYRNQVILQGRISGKPERKKLPSGDTIVQFRLIVDRKTGLKSKGKSTDKKRREVDTLDIGVWKKGLQIKALSLVPEQFAKIEGAIRRNFWTTPAGLASRYQIDAEVIERL